MVHKRRRMDRPALLRRKSSHCEGCVGRGGELVRRGRMVEMDKRRRSEGSDFMYTSQQAPWTSRAGVSLGETSAHHHPINSER